MAEPEQVFGTGGIAAIDRPRALTRFVMKIVQGAERLNLNCAIHGNPPVYDNAIFPWAADIEKAYPDIRAELDHVLKRKDELPNFHDISTDVNTISTDNRWKTFFLVGFGKPSANNIAQCPRTWKALQKIPGLKTVMFSVFDPVKHLRAHRGPYNGVLRLHLGLIVPEPRDKIAIRVVLFVEFVKLTRFPANAANWLLFNLAIFTPFIQEGMENHKAWEKKFYAEAEKLRNAKQETP